MEPILKSCTDVWQSWRPFAIRRKDGRSRISGGWSPVLLLVLGLLAWCGGPDRNTACGAELTDAIALFRSGKYEACAELSQAAIEAGEYSETWRLLKIEADLARGFYPQAQQTLDQSLERFTTSVRLRWLGATVCRYNGDEPRARKLLEEIDQLVSTAAWRYGDPAARVTLGRFFLSRGIDAKKVLEATFAVVKKSQPDFADAYLAAGQLALEKHDYALAAEEFEKALKLDATDPAIHFGLARAYAPSDRERQNEHLQRALQLNPRHVDSLLQQIDAALDQEQFDEVRELLQRVLAVNPLEPRAWAYRSVLAHLDQHDERGEWLARNVGLAWWEQNPEVDHLIGLKLSQHYRFREGAAYQRRALALNPAFQPARAQLAQDLLRLGDEEEGWQLADEVFEQDPYQVIAHNLTTLRDHLRSFRTLTTDGFVVRMDPREADIYGDQVLGLLRRARETLCAKYEVRLEQPILIEIFPEQQDFAIRTFGLPGGEGFLGVCFGNVITANSPASQGSHPANWESVLWHEFCHVVTLHKTRNAMPRWLSEGISVYEERQANAAWGQWLTPQNRAMLLGEELTPVSELSGAFLHPASPEHLQFAYFQSSLVVEFLIERYGFDTLLRVLTDLGAGMPINESLGRYAGSIEALDQEFVEYAHGRAKAYGPDVDWTEPTLDRADRAAWTQWLADHPQSYFALKELVAIHLRNEEWQAARPLLLKWVELLPDDRGGDSAWEMLALVHRRLNDPAAERQALETAVKLGSDSVASSLRLAELAAAEGDWEAVQQHAERLLAINPLLPAVQKHLARAAEETGSLPVAIQALRASLLLSSFDQVDVHYRLACLLHRAGNVPEAKRHVLLALEEAPRFRAGHEKLLELIALPPESQPAGSPPAGSQPAGSPPAGSPPAPSAAPSSASDAATGVPKSAAPDSPKRTQGASEKATPGDGASPAGGVDRPPAGTPGPAARGEVP